MVGIMSGGQTGDAGAYFFSSLTTNGTANTVNSNAKSKNYNIWQIWNDSDTAILFRFPNGSSADFISVATLEHIEFRMSATGWDDKSTGTSKAYRIFAIE